ncbi:MAG: DUF2779 domain-containing protein [Proteobacteria bacterium]|nr:DUF2779 domain-containing protein [Pseudomonadota bacterium]
MEYNKKDEIYLNKSLFIRALQCHKSLYLKKHQPDLAETPSEDQQARMESGQEVGILAQDLFPGGIEIPYEGLSYDEQLARTDEAVRTGHTIYEGAFRYDNIFIKVDILYKGADGWELYEVKGSTEVKEYHTNDISLQYYVLKNAGIPVSRACLVHINNQYIRNGEIEVGKLFISEDLTGMVQEKESLVREEVAKMREMLNGDVPQIDIGSYCDDPYPCDFSSHCWKHIREGSVFDLAGRGVDRYDLYYKGVKRLIDIPTDILTNSQRIQVECARDKSSIIDKEQLRKFLSRLWYPLYFLDFETYMPAIPLYDGMSPYQQMPFQYSLFVQINEGVPLQHYEYIAQPNVDPRRELIEKLLYEIPQGSCGLAYNSSFEVNRLNELAVWLPEYKDTIAEITENIIDLAIPFRSKYVYSWEMCGSYSQKAVLPALVPELSYNGMEVADGGMAMDAYFQMCTSKDQDEIERIRKALLEYCKLDTLGMVKILEKLKALIL